MRSAMDTTVHSVGGRQTIRSIGTAISSLQPSSMSAGGHDLSVINEKKNNHHRDNLNHASVLRDREKMDPYKEFELYLAKVIEEIDDIIVTSPPTPSIESPVKKFPTSQSDSRAQSNTSIVLDRSNVIFPFDGNTSESQNTSPTPTPFRKIVPVEITSFVPSREVIETPVIQYRDLLNEFGLSDSEYSEDSYGDNSFSKNDLPKVRAQTSCHLNSDHDEPKDMILTNSGSRRKSESSPGNLYSAGRSEQYEATSSDYEDTTGNFPIGNTKLENRNSSSLPTDFGFARQKNEPKKLLNLSLKLSFEEPSKAAESPSIPENSNAKLPPRQTQESRGRRPNSAWSPMSLKPRRLPYGKLQKIFGVSENDFTEPDYDDVFIENDHQTIFRSKSLDEHVPHSAPVTPTEEKRGITFPKILRKRYAPIYRDSIHEAVLVSVLSLPDEDLLNISNERLSDEKIRSSSSDMATRKRAISPLTLKCDVIAQRLSESDKDVNQTSPVKLKIFSKLIKQNDVAIVCNLSNNGRNSSETSIESEKSDGRIKIPELKIAGDLQDSRSGSLPISLTALLSGLRNGSNFCCPSSPPIESFACSDMATQTSPAISRSSSFTWVSECDSPQAESHLDEHSLRDESVLDPASPQNTVDDDNRSSSSSQDLLQSMDEISSGSISPDTTDRASPLESGIGTASPPRSTDRRLIKPSTNNKCHKGTWEKIRINSLRINSRNDQELNDVWIRRESVHTQTQKVENRKSQEAVDSSSGLEDTLPRAKPPRPTNLPLGGLTITTSSSLSSGDMLEALPRAPSSPSAASLQLKHEPLGVELNGKSNSAPLLENNHVEIIKDQKQIVQPLRSQSERQLSGLSTSEGDHSNGQSGRSHERQYSR